MFYYFGYGSNMSITSLKAKGVEPLSAEPAILKDWKLAFNIPDFFLIEGGTGNIVPCDASEVHGILYSCREEHLSVLDGLEAVGVNYRRVKVVVETYGKRAVSAFTYIGIDERLRDGYQPSRRYLNILRCGAEQMGIDPRYRKTLDRFEVKTNPVYAPFHFPARPADVFSKEDLIVHKNYVALAGAVFDMSEARAEHAYLREFLAGKDMTLFFLRRMDSSQGSETMDDIRHGRLTNEQRRYLNNYLHEFDREYKYVGKMDYQVDLTRMKRQAGHRLEKPQTPSNARSVLETAEKANSFLGHENLGFLSSSHGFLPRIPPKEQLPQEFRIWDEVIQDFPRLHQTLHLRKVIDSLPLLDASDERLPDSSLLRAAAILAMLVHGYYYVETSQPGGVPYALQKPWAQVRQRLGRESEVLSYIDLIVYNWRLLNPALPDPFQVENMSLLFPTVGNREESVFYLTQIEILGRSAPIIAAVARCHEAVRHDDPATLEHELATIHNCLQTIVEESLPKINPNAASSTFVDAVIWAKTVAPFAVPIRSGMQGPSGTSSPIFNLLDAFFGRSKHETFLGREIKGLRGTYPPFWRDYIEAVAALSVPDYVRKVNDPNLAFALRDTFAMYSGPNGFLGRHRMKVYGYLETAFKVGRSVTIGGFAGLFKDRTWEQVDMELEYSRIERQESFPARCHYGRIKAVGQTHLSGHESVKHIVIDISGSGIHYRPGDRCGILPENSESLIAKTLEAMEASGDETIQLTEEWLRAVPLRNGYEEATSLPLRDFLRFAKIRPVVPRVAEALHAISQNRVLATAIKGQRTVQWEVCDLLLVLKGNGFDPKLLWQSSFHAPTYIARILPPEQFRMYSISSAPDVAEEANELHLTVGRLRYTGNESHDERLGTASNFLATGTHRNSPVSLIIDHPPRFCLPKDPRTPIIMIAGGTGFAPFRSFISQRMQEKDSGPCWILLSLKSRDHFYYQDDLLPGLARGLIKLDAVFSQEETRPVFVPSSFNQGSFQYRESSRGHIQDLLLDDEIAEQLWRMLQSPADGGLGAHLYICGRTRFAKSIQDTLKWTFARFFKGSEDFRLRAAHESICRIAAEGRLMQEIFTHARAWNAERREFNVSDVVDRNNDHDGFWMVIDNIVYDLTDFIGLHPGGRTVLLNYCGLDATQGFMKVHHGHSEIEAMRDMYEIGYIRPLDFKGASRTARLPGGMNSVVSVAALYRKWIGMLYLIVEMENALLLDQSLQRSPSTRGEIGVERSNYRLQRSIETHQRFLGCYAGELGGKIFSELWDLTSSMSGVESPWMKDVMTAIHAGRDAAFPAALIPVLEKKLKDVIDGRIDERPDLVRVCRQVEETDLKLLRAVKQSLKQGLIVFEKLQASVLDEGSQDLLAALRQIPNAFETYYRDARRIFEAENWPRESVPFQPQTWVTDKVEVLAADRYWTLEEHPDEKIALLRRSPIPVEDIEDLVESNERIIALFEPRFEDYGIIVDIREAPQRNDFAFENAMLRLRLALSTNFARLAILLESATGILQVNRIGRNDGAEAFATMNEYAAVKFAKGPPPIGETTEPSPSH